MKKIKVTLLPILTAAAMLSACAKKNSDFASRYAKNQSGATVVDGQKTQEAAEQAAAQGLEVDIVNIQKYWTDANDSGPRFVSATILINNQQMTVTTSHVDTNVSRGYVDAAGFRIYYHALCANAECNPYYSMLEVAKNGQRLIQEGVKKYFDTTSGGEDVYQWFKPEEALPFMGTSLDDPNGMVGFLNQGSLSSSSEFLE